ncbi:flavin-containing monooxygenase FMO GS-OX5-like isoform X1 [Camellia sinensis]|uniref:flavin-containing monooxygenase FMO GS-OX5-like isoform X1 n=1 Tax=Camellia sinensis TaxID=4442 RepID=UPI0010368254|nr:flavin-containing monooxygenase FMO GS-OX5-like isoform X1 [Camellia sinensis]
MRQYVKAAVIGAGVAGLVAARELQREGHRVTIFEKLHQLGGSWVYDPRVEDDPLGLDSDREIVHSSVYLSLRTNLPRHIMGFSDYPFRKIGDPRNFPGHEEVVSFLNEFAREFGLVELIRLETEVVRVEAVVDSVWVVESRTSGVSLEEVFEAVVVCNGHHTEPRLANLPGIERWAGKQVHSHNYRIPEPFRDQVVVMIGDGPSAHDISRDIATVAKEVHLSSRSPDVEVSKLNNHNNVWQHSKIDQVYEDGTVSFQDGISVCSDVIFHSTGYKYHFPFLRTNGIVSVEDNRVGPLYKHVFPPQLSPQLSFIGIPYRAILFHMMELQSKWVAQVLSGKVHLPSKAEMLADVQQHYQRMEECGIPKHHTHRLHPNELQFEYLDWLAAQVGVLPVEERLREIYWQVYQTTSSPTGHTFRDEWVCPTQKSN